MQSKLSPHKFAAGQQVVYVCFGADPTYAAVPQPEFLVCHVTVLLATKSGKSVVFSGDASRSATAHFEYRTALAKDESRLNAILAEMLEEAIAQERSDANPSKWLPGPAGAEIARKAALCLAQYERGEFSIVHESTEK